MQEKAQKVINIFKARAMHFRIILSTYKTVFKNIRNKRDGTQTDCGLRFFRLISFLLLAFGLTTFSIVYSHI